MRPRHRGTALTAHYPFTALRGTAHAVPMRVAGRDPDSMRCRMAWRVTPSAAAASVT